MTSESPNEVDAGKVEELLGAAGVLLEDGALLDAIRVLHGEIARALGDLDAAGLPECYSSLAEARQIQQRLRSEWNGPPGAPLGRVPQLRELWRRRPAWSARVAVIVVLVGLCLRYAWAVSDKDNWAGQHPEGNWVSRFYTNPNFEGFPLVRYDVGVNQDFGSGAPAKSMSKDHFSARWDTCVVATGDVTLPLHLVSDDQSKLLIDGVPQMEVGPVAGEASAALVLHPGLRHLRVEFVENEGMALIRLEGLDLDGTTAYRFQRPLLDGNDVRCE
jgi:hypothetical protein